MTLAKNHYFIFFWNELPVSRGAVTVIPRMRRAACARHQHNQTPVRGLTNGGVRGAL
jgi:hypothetical protein